MDAGCWGGVDSVSLSVPGIGIMSHSLAPEFMIQEIVMADTAGLASPAKKDLPGMPAPPLPHRPRTS